MTDTKLVVDRAKRIGRLLAGLSPMMQGAILTDLTATWLAGHVDLSSRAETGEVREALLKAHIDALRPLIEVNAKLLGLPW